MIYLNGHFMPLEEARIPVLDRGFIFGDGIYEVIPAYSRKPFRLDEHLDRLAGGLAAVRIPDPHPRAEWRRLIQEILTHNEGEDQYLYLHVTRGVAKRDHVMPPNPTPTVFLMSTPLPPPAPHLRERGIAAVTAVDNRWLRCDIKTTSLLANVLLRQVAADAGAAETVLLRDGFLTEGSSSNVFVVKEGVLHAPAKDHRMLPGITYDVVLELAAAHGIQTVLGPVPETLIRTADEIWISSSVREVLPVTVLDGRPVGTGTPGPLFLRINTLYQDFKAGAMRA